MKSGVLTSELWVTVLTILAAVVGVVLSSGLVSEGSTWAAVLSIVAAVLAALGYTWQRTSLKKAALSLPAKKR